MDYRGELILRLHRDMQYPVPDRVLITFGERIAQGIVLPYPKVEFHLVDELSDTDRGTGGFGSTGA